MATVALLSAHLIQAQEQAGAFRNTFESYLSVSTALVNSDADEASQKAEAFLSSLQALEKTPLQPSEKKAVESALPELKKAASDIAAGKNLKTQREALKSLSSAMFSLTKAFPHQKPVYYNNCPMAKGNWLSEEKAIRNPYYGSQMLSCGKTVETLK